MEHQKCCGQMMTHFQQRLIQYAQHMGFRQRKITPLQPEAKLMAWSKDSSAQLTNLFVLRPPTITFEIMRFTSPSELSCYSLHDNQTKLFGGRRKGAKLPMYRRVENTLDETVRINYSRHKCVMKRNADMKWYAKHSDNVLVR